MIKAGIPFCDGCHAELRREEADGWTDWRTAHKHYCHGCYETILDKIGYPPCKECETHPCERGRDCWADPPLHLFPYETYYAETVGETSFPQPEKKTRNLPTVTIPTPKDRPLTDYLGERR